MSTAAGPFGTLRVMIRLLAMAAWLAIAVVLFHSWKLANLALYRRARNPWPRRFLGGIARIAGVRVRSTGTPAAGRLLLLANHISWIDVPALAATTGTAFVAHDGLASVPLLKWLCEMNGTIFVARHDRNSIAAQIAALRHSMSATGTMTIFPESTTSHGTTLLPFKTALLAALDPLPPDITVQPVWLDYGPLASDIAWVGVEPGVANFKRILARTTPLDLTIHFLAPLTAAPLANRKAMALAAHQAITQAMTQAMTKLQKPGGLP